MSCSCFFIRLMAEDVVLPFFFVVLAEFSKNASRAQLSFRVWNCAKQWAVNTCEASKADEDDWIVLIRLHSFCSWNQTAFKGVDVTWCALDKARLCRKPNWHRNLLPRHIDVKGIVEKSEKSNSKATAIREMQFCFGPWDALTDVSVLSVSSLKISSAETLITALLVQLGLHLCIDKKAFHCSHEIRESNCFQSLHIQKVQEV